MELKATRFEVDAGVATVWLNRPERNNAWTGRMHTEYRWILDRLEADASVRCVVVTGTGRSFCVGGDSDALAGHVERGGYDPGVPVEAARPGYGTRPETDADLAWHWGLRLPVIAAVNGGCAGVGLALACFCDLRFAAAHARLSTAAPKLGLPAEYGLSWVLPRLVGVTHAADLLLSGRVFTAEEGAAMGLFNAVVPAESTLEHALSYARRLAVEVSPASVAATKRQLYDDLVRGDVGASVRDGLVLLDRMMAEPDYREGVAALREKRPPRF
ncbi:MAG TPA: enoyl-CoA hydratase-related protein [Acidimicrobiales bacterium]